MPAEVTAVSRIQRTTLTAAAFEQLISYVVNGRWKAGDRIPPERDLCQQLGIARTSLREALKAMELVGMVESRVGHGTFVSPRSEFLSRPLLWAFTGTDTEELQDIMEARVLVEENLAGLAAQRATDEEIDAIRKTLEELEACIARGQPILDVDMQFHLAIARASHNNVLANAVQLLRNMMREWIYYKVLVPDVAPRVLKRHWAIYKAIEQRNAEIARREMREHLEEAMNLVERIMKERATERHHDKRAAAAR